MAMQVAVSILSPVSYTVLAVVKGAIGTDIMRVVTAKVHSLSRAEIASSWNNDIL